MVKMITQCVTQCSENDILKGCLLFGVMIFRQCKVINTSWYMSSILAISLSAHFGQILIMREDRKLYPGFGHYYLSVNSGRNMKTKLRRHQD
jgi:hypothetical protein